MRPVTLYTTEACPFCTSAKALLAKRGIAPVSYDEWLRIETAEADLAQALGRGERVKLHNRDAIWSACRPEHA